MRVAINIVASARTSSAIAAGPHAGCCELVRITLLYSVSDVPTTREFPLALMRKSETIVASGGRPCEIDRKLRGCSSLGRDLAFPRVWKS